MVSFLDQTKDRISKELETGNAAEWAYVLSESEDPSLLPAMRAVLHRQDVPDHVKSSAVRYFWILGSPQAIDALREAYDRQVTKSDTRSWLRLCEALASKGDGRGLPDAFDVLIELERASEPPLEEQKRRTWESTRDQRKQEAEAVFERASKETLAGFLDRKTGVFSAAEQALVLRLLWRLPDVPKSFASVLPSWAGSPNPKVAELARRLLDRR
jgi:HEAT repeat protein